MLYHLKVTPAQLKRAADWSREGFADVALLADGSMLLVEQGDDSAAWDTDGSPATETYMMAAPIDPPTPMIPVDELAAAIGLHDADSAGILNGSAADQCAGVYELLARYGVTVA